MAIGTITKQRMDAAVYDALLADIKNGTWKSGEKLPSETDLGQRMGVSRVTVRAAIQRLQAIGLVEVKHGKGTYVVKPEEIYDMSNFERELDLTEKEFNEINALREAIEIQSIRLIMQQERVDLESIGSAYFGMKRALAERNYEEYTKQDYMFHLSIILASGNDIFIQIINIFKNMYYKYFQELNKFMFENTKESEALLQSSLSSSDSHSKLYHYLTHQNDLDLNELMTTFTDGNKKRFQSYLQKRDRERKRRESAKNGKKES